MSENIEVSRIIPAKPERLFKAWLDAKEHGAMTGSSATDEGGGAFTAWDGYISGKTLASQAPGRIEQSWRTTEFPEGAPDSKLVITFTPAEAGTKVTFSHSGIPDGQGKSYEKGWDEFYFTPMTQYFGSATESLREAGADLEAAAARAEAAVEVAAHEVGDAVSTAAKKALKAVDQARTTAAKQARKAVKSVKKFEKQAEAKARGLGKQVKALVKAGKKKAAAVTKQVTAKKKVAAKKPAPKKKVAAKRAAPKKKPAAKKTAAKRK